MRALWRATSDLIAQHPNGGWLGGEWRLPVGDAVAVLEPDRSGEKWLVVKTVLAPP
jgi:hypothetical protein